MNGKAFKHMTQPLLMFLLFVLFPGENSTKSAMVWATKETAAVLFASVNSTELSAHCSIVTAALSSSSSSFTLPEWPDGTEVKRKASHLHDWHTSTPCVEKSPPVTHWHVKVKRYIYLEKKKANGVTGAGYCCRRVFPLWWWWRWKGFLHASKAPSWWRKCSSPYFLRHLFLFSGLRTTTTADWSVIVCSRRTQTGRQCSWQQLRPVVKMKFQIWHGGFKV